MLIFAQVDPIETLTEAIGKNYPALTSITGSPFDGADLTDQGDGQWSINVGSVAGNWKFWLKNADGDVIGFGYASSDYVDGSGNATLTDYAPWLSIPILDPAAGGGFEAGTLEISQGDSYDDVANAKKIWAVSKDYRTWVGTFTIRHRVTNALLVSVVATATAANQVEVELDTSDTAFASFGADSEYGPHPYDIQFAKSGSKERPLFGRAIVYRFTPGDPPGAVIDSLDGGSP